MFRKLRFLERTLACLAVPGLTINPHNSPDFNEIRQIMGKGEHAKLFL